MSDLIFRAELTVHNKYNEAFCRFSDTGKIGRINRLAEGEFYSFSLFIRNQSRRAVSFSAASVRVDGGEAWEWGESTLAPGAETEFHIYECNMKTLSLGVHHVCWCFNGETVCSDAFSLTEDLDWPRITRLPTKKQIALYRNPTGARSPYVSIWMRVPAGVRYREYSVDFKADHLPRGTYCALANFAMDHSSLKKIYPKVQPQGITAYAGFQNISDGRKMAIMSFWDFTCTDHRGIDTLIRARIEHPSRPEVGRVFDNEGVGMQCINPFSWEANHWYRMHLRCYESAKGTTLVEMWAADLESGAYSLICRYDTCVANSAFVGDMAIFLENFDLDRAGEIRTLEFCNAKYLNERNGRWGKIGSGTFYINGTGDIRYAGSYDFGVKNGHLWMMSTGLDGFGSIKNSFDVRWDG